MIMFLEIFGFEPLPKPSAVQPKAEPVLPFDDWRWQHQPQATGEYAAKLIKDAFCDEITGDCSTPETALGDFPALEQFRKIVPLPTPVVTPIAPKVTDAMFKRAPEHKRTVASILSEFKKRLGGPEGREGWDRLQRSCEKFVQQALAEAT